MLCRNLSQVSYTTLCLSPRSTYSLVNGRQKLGSKQVHYDMHWLHVQGLADIQGAYEPVREIAYVIF